MPGEVDAPTLVMVVGPDHTALDAVTVADRIVAHFGLHRAEEGSLVRTLESVRAPRHHMRTGDPGDADCDGRTGVSRDNHPEAVDSHGCLTPSILGAVATDDESMELQ
jgi:hypothetical protein